MLEKLIAMVVIFCVLSLMVTILQEALQQLFSTRAVFLWYHLRRLLRDVEGNKERENEIDPRRNGRLIRWLGQARIHTAYGQVLLHPITNPLGVELPQHVNAPDLYHVLNPAAVQKLLGQSKPVDLPEFQRWYDALMAYVSASYRGKMRLLGFCISLFVVVLAHAGLGRMYHALGDSQVRHGLISAVAHDFEDGQQKNLVTASEGLHLGWHDVGELRASLHPTTWSFLGSIGVLAMTLLLSLGAPFWFEMLNRVMALRSGSQPPSVTRDDFTTHPV